MEGPALEKKKMQDMLLYFFLHEERTASTEAGK